MTKSNQTSTVLGRKLGAELLRLRVAAGFKQQEATDVLSATPTKLVKIERGWVPVRDPDIKALYEFYGCTDRDALEALLRLARLDRERRKAKGWWQQYPRAGGMAEYISMEDVATRVRTWELSLVPGLLQTAEYSRALAVGEGSWDNPDEIEPLVEVRQMRQQRLHGAQPLNLYAIVWEGALRQQIGGRTAMREQLSHLIDMAQLPNINMQVLPYRAGSHACIGGAFSIISFAESDAMDVVHSDTIGSTVWVESEEDSALYRLAFASTARASLAQHDSIALIDSIRKEM